MAVLQAEDITTLVTNTLNDLGRGRFEEIAAKYRDFCFFAEIWKKDRRVLSSGPQIQRNIKLSHNDHAKFAGLYAEDDVNVNHTMDQLTVPWRHATANYAIDGREITMNSDPARIVNELKSRRQDAMLSMAELMEDTFWGRVPDTDDNLTPWGVQYWIVANATQGFNGANPGSYSDTGGIDASATATANWTNWTDTFTNVQKDDLIANQRLAFKRCSWRSPVDTSNHSMSQNFRIYCDTQTCLDYEDLVESQNENLGHDLYYAAGRTTFKGAPVIDVPALDESTIRPSSTDRIMYGLDWGSFIIYVLKGEYMREQVQQSPRNHRVKEVHIDTSLNTVCVNRRRNYVIYKAS